MEIKIIILLVVQAFDSRSSKLKCYQTLYFVNQRYMEGECQTCQKEDLGNMAVNISLKL